MLVAAKAEIVLLLGRSTDDAATVVVPEFSMIVAVERVDSDGITAAVSDTNSTPALETVREDVATVAVPMGDEVDPGPCLS